MKTGYPLSFLHPRISIERVKECDEVCRISCVAFSLEYVNEEKFKSFKKKVPIVWKAYRE
jgi:hypothetical protein